MRILLVEDDPMIGESVVSGLAGEGHAVDWVRDGAAAERDAVSQSAAHRDIAGRAADRRPRGAWSEGPYAVLLPGAGGVHKILDEAPLASVARGLAELGLVVVVAWGPGERDRAARVAATAAAELAPPTDLVELAALLAGAALAVGGDTGPVHLAASFGVPTVAVFLASDPRRNGPLGPATAVVSGAGEVGAAPTASARAPRVRAVEADGIVAAARRLLAR